MHLWSGEQCWALIKMNQQITSEPPATQQPFFPFEMAGNVKLTANKALVKYPLVQTVGPSRLIESIARMEKLSAACLNDLNFSETQFVWGGQEEIWFCDLNHKKIGLEQGKRRRLSRCGWG